MALRRTMGAVIGNAAIVRPGVARALRHRPAWHGPGARSRRSDWRSPYAPRRPVLRRPIPCPGPGRNSMQRMRTFVRGRPTSHSRPGAVADAGQLHGRRECQSPTRKGADVVWPRLAARHQSNPHRSWPSLLLLWPDGHMGWRGAADGVASLQAYAESVGAAGQGLALTG